MNPSTRSRQLKALWVRDKGICWLCNLPVSMEDATRDHVIPASKGGGNGMKNLKLAHRDCNHRRGDNLEPAPLPKKRKRSAVDHAAINPETNLEFTVAALRARGVRGPVMNHITNENARELLDARKPLTTDEKIARQKREEP